MPLLGDKFPEMKVVTTHGEMVLPNAMQGKWFVFFSHPADFTPVCTTEFFSFQKFYPRFKALNTELIGLSMDQVFSHIKWEEWIKDNLKADIEFPIIADTGAVAERLGLIHPGKGTNTVRAVFIVDAKGIIRVIFYYPQELGRNMEEIIRSVEAMQFSDQFNCSMPANWPKNELIGDRVIIPPSKDTKSAFERKAKIKKGEIQGYDWWFAHKAMKEEAPAKAKKAAPQAPSTAKPKKK